VVFVGSHEHTLDEKGRFVLPAKFRNYFSEVAYVSPAANCLALHTPLGFEEMIDRLKLQVQSREVDRKVLRQIGASAEEVRVDAQGRVTLSQRLRDNASLRTEVVVCGVIDHVEIWSTDRWEPESNSSLVEAFWSDGGV
tara:strand:+ start:514 stop:930 length:417 start_codon:yes stop_codon:yes gene_type:complete